MANAKGSVNISKFSGGKGAFGSINNSVSQKFSPKGKVVLPPIRITQNKGGGGK